MHGHKELHDFSADDSPETPIRQLHAANISTETIDLSNLLTCDVYASGSFDLSGVASTSFGKLLDALPLPALLIDRRHCIAFANQACTKVCRDFGKILGSPFQDLLSRPRESIKAQELSGKLQSLLEKAFAVRRPTTAEVILEVDQRKIWSRLHIRSVRIGLERHLLAFIEDVTNEKRQLALSRRQGGELRRSKQELENYLNHIRAELATADRRLTQQEDERSQTQNELGKEKQKMAIVCERAALATAVVTPAGAFKEISPKFRELFGYDAENIPNFGDWVSGSQTDFPDTNGAGSALLATLSSAEHDEIQSTACTVSCRDHGRKQACFGITKLSDGDYFIICHETA